LNEGNTKAGTEIFFYRELRMALISGRLGVLQLKDAARQSSTNQVSAVAGIGDPDEPKPQCTGITDPGYKGLV
jgi:hypothetical protein